jgi:hypothetical protein
MYNKVNLIEHPERTAFMLDQASERPELPVLLTVRFEVLSDRAAVHIVGRNASMLFLQIIHEGREDIESQTIRGDQSAHVVLVHDAESLLVLARYEGAVVAGAMLQANMDLVNNIDQLLYPVAASNIVVEQHNLRLSGASLRYAYAQADPDATICVSAVKVAGSR